MELRPDMLDDRSPDGIEVVQLTDEDVPSSDVYMEAQGFTLDSERFILHRSAHAHGSDKSDPQHRYLVCEIDNDCSLRPITNETGVTAPSVITSTGMHDVGESQLIEGLAAPHAGQRVSRERVGSSSLSWCRFNNEGAGAENGDGHQRSEQSERRRCRSVRNGLEFALQTPRQPCCRPVTAFGAQDQT
jgi:hypothetical protein